MAGDQHAEPVEHALKAESVLAFVVDPCGVVLDLVQTRFGVAPAPPLTRGESPSHGIEMRRWRWGAGGSPPLAVYPGDSRA